GFFGRHGIVPGSGGNGARRREPDSEGNSAIARVPVCVTFLKSANRLFWKPPVAGVEIRVGEKVGAPITLGNYIYSINLNKVVLVPKEDVKRRGFESLAGFRNEVMWNKEERRKAGKTDR